MTHPLFRLVAQLNNLRRLYPALSLGTYVDQGNNPSGPGLFAYSRRSGTQEVFVVFNTAGVSQTLPGCKTIYPSGTKLINLLNPDETIFVTGDSQTPTITVPPTSAKIFLARTQVLPLDPVITTSDPRQSETAVPTSSSIVLQFSKSMDTNSVQKAFSIDPAVGGTFRWSSGKDTMTFSPVSTGLAGLTNVIVRINNRAVDDVSHNAMFATYELKFTTAASTF